MKTTNKIFSLTLVGALLLAGCGTTNDDTRYVESTSPETIISINQIDIQDWYNAADQMVASLLDSGMIKTQGNQPAVMLISRIVNDTTIHINTNNITQKIRVALNRSGLVQTKTTEGVTVEDELARETQRKYGFEQTEAIPDYTLSGEISELRTGAKDIKQVSYIFRLNLTDIRTGLAIWSDEVAITKQGTGAKVGW